jgi:hypothetical protein
MGEWIYRSTFLGVDTRLEVSDQIYSPAALPPGKEPLGTQWIGGWVELGAGLDDVEKRKSLMLPGVELRPLGSPARS